MSEGMSTVLARIAEIQARFPLTPVATPGDVSLTRAGGAGAPTMSFDQVLASATMGRQGAVGLDALSSGGPVSGLAGIGGIGGIGGISTTPGGASVVAAARRYLGVPYLWGGTDPARGLDCSGFVRRVFADLGVQLPRVSPDQARAGAPVASLGQAQPGDLLFFDNNSSRAGIDHVAIYLGGGRMIEAPRSGLTVRETDVPGEPVAIRRVAVAGEVAPVGAAAPGVTSAGPYGSLIAAAEGRYRLPDGLLAAVARAESGMRPNAVSPAGAAGLMQLMPATARGLGVDPYDPAQAIDGAGRLLAGYLRDFGSLDLALAAYNAGPGAVRRYGGVPPYAETQAYVRRVRSYLGDAS